MYATCFLFSTLLKEQTEQKKRQTLWTTYKTLLSVIARLLLIFFSSPFAIEECYLNIYLVPTSLSITPDVR